MDNVNVLIAIRLEEELQRQLANVDRRVKVINAVDLLRAKVRGTASAEEHEKLVGLFREAEVLFALMRRFPADLLSQTPKLRWVQLVSAGIDEALEVGLLDKDITVTNARGIHTIPIAEYTLGIMLLFAKRIPLYLANKQEKQWKQLPSSELRGKTLGIIGLGSIGQEVARLANAFGMRIVATRRSAVRQELSVMGVDKVYPRRDLPEMLGECDFVVLSVPLTEETTKMIGEEELKAMKPSSFLINVSRGEVIDEAVLIRALKEEWIAGAGLDVFEKEPLPPESELWEIPNVIISPHISWGSEITVNRLTELACENLKRYLTKQPLLNVVDKEKGY